MGLVSPGAYAEYARIDGEVPVRDLIAHYTDVDIVIVEGYKTAGLPSIAVARSGIDRMRGRDSFELIDENTLAVACNDVVARDFRTRAAKAPAPPPRRRGALSTNPTSRCRLSSTSTTLPLSQVLYTTTCKI